MTKKPTAKTGGLYVGVDIGGTKIQATLAAESGAILARRRRPTPRDCTPRETLAAIEGGISDLLAGEGLKPRDLAAIGVAAPGVVDPDKGLVVFTPNMNLSGVRLGKHLAKKCHLPVAVGNDCNLGTLGETWLGSARDADSAFGVFVGTGIGGGFVRKGEMLRGHREAAAEVGHIVMEVGGPRCGCGNRGCFEALASRSAIERDIRKAVAAGRKTVLTDLLDGDLGLIRSGALREALEQRDELVTDVMRRAAETLGHGCLTVRHLLDPEAIVLGGGVIEACDKFVVPVVERILAADGLTGARHDTKLLVAALGDDAVALGAVALARCAVGRSPFRREFLVRPRYPRLRQSKSGQIAVDDKTYPGDIAVRVDGRVKKPKADMRKTAGGALRIEPRGLARACKGGPEVVFVGQGEARRAKLTQASEQFLRRRAIECEVLATSLAVEAYNRCKRRKAALLCVPR